MMQKADEKTFGRFPAAVILMVISVMVFIMVLTATHAADTEVSDEPVKLFDNGWYTVEEGKKVPLKLPAVINGEAKEALVIYNDSLSKSDGGKTLTTRGVQYGMTASVGEQEIYKYEDKGFPRNTQMKSKQDCDIRIPYDFDGGTLAVTYEKPLHGEFEVAQFWIGDGDHVLMYHFEESMMTYAIAFIFVILGILALGTAVFLRLRELEARRFVDAALFLLTCAVWFVTDTSLVQQYGGNAPIICVISFYAFMLLSVPMIFVVKNTGDMKKYKSIDVLTVVFFANAIIQGILNTWMSIEFIDMLLATHIILAVGVIMLIALLAKESHVSGDRDVKMIFTAFATVGISGVLALVLYWLFEIPYYGNIFQLGILIFILIILANIIISMAENIHYRTEMMAYQRMLKEDWMTGLGNRQPFEEYLTEIQMGTKKFENVGLIFMDINHLKKINDEFGHAAGDEVIIGAAKCITKAFSEAGSCYRIGGDEFGVIMPNPKGECEEWFEKLDNEIAQYNRTGRYTLSIARGFSRLRGEDGLNKSISDWKYEADYRMYENKGGFKRV